ncbi:MAG: hypothetical protein ACW99Q_29210 [Candidatus Kariarchaeaceae archaeon]
MKERLRYGLYVLLLIILIMQMPSLRLVMRTGTGYYGLSAGYHGEKEILSIDWSPAGDVIGFQTEEDYYYWRYLKWHSNVQFLEAKDNSTIKRESFSYFSGTDSNFTDVAWNYDGSLVADTHLSLPFNDPLIIRTTNNFSKNTYGLYTKGRNGNFTSLSWFHNEGQLFVSTDNGMVYLWSENEPKDLQNVYNHTMIINKISLSNNNNIIALASNFNNSNFLQFVWLSNYTLFRSYEIEADISFFQWLPFTSVSALSYLVKGSSKIKLISPELNISDDIFSSGTPIQSFKIDNEGELIGIVSQGNLNLFNLTSGLVIYAIDEDLWIDDFDFSPDDSMIIHNTHNILKIRSLKDLKVIYELPYIVDGIKHYTHPSINTARFVFLSLFAIVIMVIEGSLHYYRSKRSMNQIPKNEIMYPDTLQKEVDNQ